MTKPQFPLAGYALAVAVAIGLIALSIAAYTAFASVMTPAHAFFAAMVVEVGAVVESLALARARTWRDGFLALAAVAASVLVSATYNYTQVAQAAAQLKISQWELVMLALGPLVALVFLSLNFGRELRAYELDNAAYQSALHHAAQSKTALTARAADNAAYDAQKAAERAAVRAHELRLEQLRLQAPAPIANAPQSQRKARNSQSATQGAQPNPIPAQPKPAWGQSQAAARALHAEYPNATGAQIAAALQIHPSQVTLALKLQQEK